MEAVMRKPLILLCGLTILVAGVSSCSNEPQISPEEQQRILNEETRAKYVAYVKCVNDTYVSIGKGKTIAGVDGTDYSIRQYCRATTGHQG